MPHSFVCPHGGPDCPGWYTLNVPFGHPDFGRSFPCECARYQRAEQLRRDLPAALARKQFDTFEVNAQNRVAVEAARAFAGADPVAGWLTLGGTVGNGKTHLAAAITNTLLERGVPVMLCAVPALLDEWRATFAPQSGVAFDDHFEAIRSSEVLVLDDLGAESATAWAQDKLYQLFDHRYVHRLPTVITTNARWMDIPERIRSRLSDSELGRVVVNAAPDYRSAEGKKAYTARKQPEAEVERGAHA